MKTSPLIVLAFVLVASSLVVSGALVYSTNNVVVGINNVKLNNINSGNNGINPTPIATAQPTPVPPVELTDADVNILFEAAAGTKGDENAKVTILEFSDYQCPFCRRHFNTAYKQIITEYVDSGKAKIAFLDFPLSFHPMAVPSANAARCAGEQGKYWEAHNAIFEGQNKKDPVQTVEYTIDEVKTWIGEVAGIDKAKLNACIDSNKYNGEVQANFEAGAAAGIQGTPGFFINGKLVSGAQPFEAFKQAIDAELN